MPAAEPAPAASWPSTSGSGMGSGDGS
jgi:hypothetical protein